MRNHVYTMITLAVLSSVCSASSYDDSLVPSTELKTAKSSGGFLKTAIVGALMALSPAPVQAQQTGFVGAYLGTVSSYAPLDSNNISVANIYLSNYNNFYNNGLLGGGIQYVNSMILSTPFGNFTMKIECAGDSSCDEIYIKSTTLCNKTFAVNYYASLKYNPMGFTSSQYWYNYALSVWKSIPAPNTTAFDKTFNSVLRNKTCNVSTI